MASPGAGAGATSARVVGVPISGVVRLGVPNDDDKGGGTPALAVPVGSNPAYLARSMALKRMVRGIGHAVAFVTRASRKVAPEGNEQQKANALVGVSEAFLDDFLTRVLPQFGLTREALSTPKTREEWLQRLSPKKDVHRVDVTTENDKKMPVTIGYDADGRAVELVDLGDGLQARKSDVEHVRKLVRLPRCRNNFVDWELVEAEVDLKELPDKIDADTPLPVRVKGDPPDAKWIFLPARDVALVQTSDIVDFVIKPITQWKNGKLLEKNKDGEDEVVKSERKAYVDHVADVHPKGHEWVERNYFGKADIFVSHAWMDSYQDFSDAMTGGSSKGSKHYQNHLAGRFNRAILDHLTFKVSLASFVKRIHNHLFRTWMEDSAPRWQRWLADFILFLFVFPSFLAALSLSLLYGISGIPLLVHFLPETWLKGFVTNMNRWRDDIDWRRRWVDIFCKNQWVVNSDDTETELQDGVGNVDKLWLVTHSWHTPHALKRAWCQFELRAARVKNVDIVGIACNDEGENLRNNCRAVLNKRWFWWSLINPFSCGNTLRSSKTSDEFELLDKSLNSIDARTAESRFPEDKERILELIRQGVENGDDGDSDERQQGNAAIDAHNEDLQRSYLYLISRMMDGYVGGKFMSFMRMNVGYCALLFVIIPFFVAKTELEFTLWFFGSALALGCLAVVLSLAKCVEIQIRVYYILPLLRTEEEKRNLNRKAKSKKIYLFILLFAVLVIAITMIYVMLAVVGGNCAAHHLASDPLVPSCTFSAMNTAPRDVREYRHHVIGTYYQMPNKTINGKPVFEAYNDDEDRMEDTRRAISTSCHKRYLYYSDRDRWIVSDFKHMELGKDTGWIFSETTHVDSPAWLPADERWMLYIWDDDRRYYDVLQLTCRNLPAIAPPPPPPPPASTPACTFVLRDDAPAAINDDDADHVLGTYYLMSNKTVNDRPVFQMNLGRYLYYSDRDRWIVSDFKHMELGEDNNWIFSETTHVDSPAWLPADERWMLYIWDDVKTYYDVLQLTCRNLPAIAPPPPPPPPASTPACTFVLRDDAPAAISDDDDDADHVLGTYYLMSNKTVNDRPVFQMNLGRYLYYSDRDRWIVSDFKHMELGEDNNWIFSETTHVDSPAWLPADERWMLGHNGERYYDVLQLTCRNLPAAPPSRSSSSTSHALLPL
ncbi:hypothetical protein RI054_18g83270 [Pseudoscourfieldia marina]